VSKSLQDQLLALGLAKTNAKQTAPDKPQANKPAADRQPAAKRPGTERRPAEEKSARQGRPHPDPRPKPQPRPQPRPDPRNDENISLEQAYRIREAEEKSAKQRARERKLEEDRLRAMLNRQIRQVIDSGRLNLPDASESRYFMYKARIRKVHVSPEQLAALNKGELGVVYLAGGYHILASEQVEEVRKLSPAHVPDLLAGGDDDPFDEADFAADELRANEPGVSGSEPDSDDKDAAGPENAGESSTPA